MGIRAGRIIIFAILAEFLAILTLVLIVAVFGPSEPEAAQAYAKKLGFWVGPIAGFSFTLLGAWWITRDLGESQLLNGFLLGVAVAAIDIAILVASGASFLPIFAVSNAGRVVAGLLGGLLSRAFRPTRQQGPAGQ